MEDSLRRMEPVSAPPDERPGVAALHRALKSLKALQEAVNAKALGKKCRLVGPEGKSIEIPESVFYVLERVAEVLANGDGVSVVPVGKELTTQQAADLLNVSRQYLVRLLEAGKIPFTRTGKHRRIRMDELLAFKRERDKERRAALEELQELSEDFGGYPELK
jgi:excisionase family DNA binding protein